MAILCFIPFVHPYLHISTFWEWKAKIAMGGYKTGRAGGMGL